MKTKFLIPFILVFTFLTNINLFAQKQLFTQYNLNFEIGNLGENASGWTMSNVVKKFGYETKLTTINKSEGQKALNIYHNGKKYAEDMYGSVYQGLDAVPFRNRKVNFSADVYFENNDDTTKVFLWMHEHFIDGSKGQFVISEMDSSKDSKWKRMSVDLQVDPFVDYINYGFYLNGKGNMFVDNAKLELISPFQKPNLNKLDLTQNDIEKLYNFTNIFSKVGFYNPKQSMYEADKFSMIHKGVNLSLGLIKSLDLNGNSLSFIDIMNEYFGKMDKNITIYNPKVSSKPNIDLNNGVNLLKKVNGESYSLLNYGAFNNKKSSTARSERNNIFGTQRTKEGSLLQVIDLNKLKLKNKLTQITIETKSKLVKYSQGANAQIWARVDVENQKESMYTTMNDKPMTDSIWTGINITMNVPKDAKAIRIGLVLVGDGEVFFDDVKITGIDATTKKINIPLENANFQDGMAIEAPKNWEVSKAVIQAGYKFEIVEDKIARSKVLKISSDKSTYIEMPKLNQFTNCKINDTISVYFPINIEEQYKDIKFEYPFDIIETNDKDAISRISAVIYLTSIINEFTNTKIDYKTFAESVTKAGDINISNTNNAKHTFEKVLAELLAKIKDSGARVWNPEITQKYSYPFTLKYNNGNVYIAQIADSNVVSYNIENGNKIANYESLLNKLKVGFKLNSINGENVKDIIEREKKYIPNNNEEFLYTRLLADLRASDSVEIDNLEFNDFENNSILIQVPKAFAINKINQERPEPLFEISKGIVYCDMTRTSDEMFKYYLNDFKELKAMIFDLRGLSIMSEYFLGFFTPKDIPSYTMELPIYTTPKGGDVMINNRILYAQSIKTLKEQLGAKLYFITDEYTIGYSELIAQTVKENKLGTLIGSKTAGGNSEIATLRLPCNYLLSLPTLNVYNSKNINITSKPVEPDVIIKYDFKNNIEYNRNNSEISQDYFINYTNNYIIETLKMK